MATSRRGAGPETMPVMSLQQIVDQLDRLPADRITVAGVQELLAGSRIDEAMLRRYVGTLPHKYARRLVHRSPRFDVLVLTWAPGQATPIHNHAGSCGWVRLVRGQIQEETYELVPGTTFDAKVAGRPVGAGSVGLVPTGSALVDEVGAIATVDRQRAIHRLGNPAGSRDVAVTLHVYSLPHDACLAFDLERRRCERRDLAFDPLPAAAV